MGSPSRTNVIAREPFGLVVSGIMQLSRWKKITLGVGGTILLGALGSGLWEQALRPLGQWLGRTLLTVVTLGSSALKDGIYREAAKGVHEAGGLQVLFLMTLLLIGLYSLPPAYVAVIRSTDKRIEKFRKSIQALGTEERITSLRKRDADLNRKLSILQIIGFGVVLLFATNTLINFLELDQANGAYTFFAQSMAICRPYLDDQQARLLESRFAGINSREDYVGVINDLRHIAASNQRKLPDFNPW
jgi:hypothetical protein